MESKEKLEKDANIAFEPYFDENTEMGVKLEGTVSNVAEEESKGELSAVLDDVFGAEEEKTEKNEKSKSTSDKKKKKKPVKKETEKTGKPEKSEKSKKPEKKSFGKGLFGSKKKKKPDKGKIETTPETVLEPVVEGTLVLDGAPVTEAAAENNKVEGKKPIKKSGKKSVKKSGKKPVKKSGKKPVAEKDGAKPTEKSSVKKSSSKKHSSKKKKKIRKISLKTQLVAVVALPILVISVVLTVNVVNSLRTNIVETEMDGLKTTAITLMSTFEGLAGDDTNYYERASVIYQGDIKITGNDKIVEKIHTNGDVQVSFVYGQKRILTSFTDADGKPMTKDGLSGNNLIDDAIYQEVVVGGKEKSDTSAEMFGETYYGYYLPLKNNVGESNEETVGLIFIGRNSETVEKIIMTETIKAIVVCAILATISIVVATVLAGNISKMINRLAGSLAKIADGNLAVEFDKKALTSGNEIGQIGRASERLKDSLNGIVSNIKESVDVLTVSAVNLEGTSDRTNTTMIEVSKAVEEIAESAGVQASETEKATINAMDMGNLIENVIYNVEELQTNARLMGEAEKASSEIIAELSKSNDRTIEAVERISVQTEYTNVSAQKIKKAVALITSIADETSLLSLNASIEAARAGEAGRGFAVVASEISKLADQSNNSATEIEKIINELLVESNKTVDIMDEVKAIVGEQEEKLNLTKAEFENVSKGIESSVSSVENISGRMVELDIAKNGIIDVIQSLSAISEENAAATEETSASVQELDSTVGSLSEAAKDLKVIAEQLDQQISVFTV